MDSVKEMVFSPAIDSPKDAALVELQTIFDGENLKSLLRHLDLDGYGQELIAADHEVLTPYGLLHRQDGELISSRQKEDQGMGMEVCR